MYVTKGDPISPEQLAILQSKFEQYPILQFSNAMFLGLSPILHSSMTHESRFNFLSPSVDNRKNYMKCAIMLWFSDTIVV